MGPQQIRRQRQFRLIRRTRQRDPVRQIELFDGINSGLFLYSVREQLRLPQYEVVVDERQRLCGYSGNRAPSRAEIRIGHVEYFEHGERHATLKVDVEAAPPDVGPVLLVLPDVVYRRFDESLRQRRTDGLTTYG